MKQNFAVFRKNAGLTQVEVAKELGVSQSTLSGFEDGSREPRAGAIVMMLHLYGCSFDELMGIHTKPKLTA
jgi:transcriptional regulator with XRE-family HTH domain